MDMKNNLKPINTIAPAGNRTATVNGAAVDRSPYHKVLAVVHSATITDGVHTPKLEEAAASGGPWNDVAVGDMNGSFAAIADDAMQTVEYTGMKSHVRVTVTVTGGPATGGIYSAMILGGMPRKAPVAA